MGPSHMSDVLSTTTTTTHNIDNSDYGDELGEVGIRNQADRRGGRQWRQVCFFRYIF
jgi:hypothetical protein